MCKNKHVSCFIHSLCYFYREEVFQCGFAGSVQEIVEASSFWHDNGEIEATCAAVDDDLNI